jgi:nucleotide-binding universal stress UspA family protein
LYGILVATKSNDDAAHVTQRAAILAGGLREATLDIFSVVTPAGTRRILSWMRGSEHHAERTEQERTMRRLSCQSEYLREQYGIRCTIASGVGALAAQVAARVRTSATDIVVLGGHAPHWTKSSTGDGEAARIARMCGRPVLLVRNEPRCAYTRIAVPNDFSDDALRVTETVMRLLPEAHITFLHSYRVAGQGAMSRAGVVDRTIDNGRLRAQRQAQAAFSTFLQRLGRPLTKFSLVLTAQPEALATRTYLRTVKPDLIALADGAASLLLGWLNDSTPWTVLNDTRCDVLLLAPRQAHSVCGFNTAQTKETGSAS